MGGIACSSGHLEVYCLTVPWELLAALAMHGVHVTLSTEGSAKLYVLRRHITNLHAWQKLYHLSIGGVACSSGNKGDICLTHPWEELLAALAI